MLCIPEQYRNFTWIGIDPGFKACGISIFKGNTQALKSVSAFTFLDNELKELTLLTENYQTPRQIKIDNLIQNYEKLLFDQEPSIVVAEQPFFNPRAPSAFGSLVEVLTSLRQATFRYNPNLSFISYAPQEVKAAFRKSGVQGKDAMRQSLSQNLEIQNVLLTPFNELDEHAIDAIAVGYTWYSKQDI